MRSRTTDQDTFDEQPPWPRRQAGLRGGYRQVVWPQPSSTIPPDSQEPPGGHDHTRRGRERRSWSASP